MVPEIVTCDQCGRTVLVLSWSPLYDDAVELPAADDSGTLDFTCKTDCPTCGTRIQRVKPAQIADATDSAA
jgi:hypothetical protein